MRYYTEQIDQEALKIATQVMTRTVDSYDFKKGVELDNEEYRKEVPIKILEEAIKIVKFLRGFSP